MKMKHVIGALAICMVAASAAQAATSYVRFIGVSGKDNVTLWGDGGYGTKDTTAGIYDLEEVKIPVESGGFVPTVGTKTGSGTPITSFCVDVTDPSTDTWQVYELVALAAAPDGTGAAMGDNKAKDIAQLFKLAGLTDDGTPWSSTYAGAIQACVWEIIRESPPTSTTTDYDLGNGSWKVTGLTTENETQASTWLTSLNTDNNDGTDNLLACENLKVLSNTEHQDFAIVRVEAVVPEPLTMASAFLAIGGLGAYIRRRTRMAVA